MRWLSGSVLLAADLLAGCGDIGAGNADRGWPEANRRAYVNSCGLNAEAAEADSEVARDYCSCTLTEFERRYSINEFERGGRSDTAGPGNGDRHTERDRLVPITGFGRLI